METAAAPWRPLHDIVEAAPEGESAMDCPASPTTTPFGSSAAHQSRSGLGRLPTSPRPMPHTATVADGRPIGVVSDRDVLDAVSPILDMLSETAHDVHRASTS